MNNEQNVNFVSFQLFKHFKELIVGSQHFGNFLVANILEFFLVTCSVKIFVLLAVKIFILLEANILEFL